MMGDRNIVAFVALIVLVGCSGRVAEKQPPGRISGKIVQQGKAVSDVVITFQPLEDGHLVGFPVADDGSFEGEVVPGKYAYFVGKSASKTSEQSLKKIHSKFLEANMDRTIVLARGQNVLISLE